MLFNLRPHHINCIFFYIGKGYSEDFVKNMTKIIFLLQKDKNNKIKFITSCDDLCKHCPNKINNICYYNDKVNKLDQSCIKIYNINLNKIYTFNEIKNNIYKTFNEKNFIKICQNCEWFTTGICSKNKIIDCKNRFKI